MFSSRILRSILVLLALSAYTLPSHGMIRTMANRLARATQTIRAQAGAKITPIATQTAQKPLIQATQPAAQQSWWHKFTASLNNAWAYIKQNITLPTWFSKNQISVYAKKVASSTAKAIGSRMPLAAGIVATAAAQAQEKEKKFTIHDIKTRNYDMAYRKEALAFALANITAQDAETIEVIIAILETYRESHEPIVNAALTHFNNTHPLLIKNILAHNAWAADKFVKLLISTENPHLKELCKNLTAGKQQQKIDNISFETITKGKNEYNWYICNENGETQFSIAKLIIDTIVATPDQCQIKAFNTIYDHITSNKSLYLSYTTNKLRKTAIKHWGKDAKTLIDLASGIINPKQVTDKPLCVYLDADNEIYLSEVATLALEEINTLSPEHISRAYNLCHNIYKTTKASPFLTQIESYSQIIQAEAQKRFNKPEIIEKMTARELLYAHYKNNYIPSFTQSYQTPPFNLTAPSLSIPLCCFNPTSEQIKKSINRDIESLPTEYIDYAYEVIFNDPSEKQTFKKTINSIKTYNTNIPLKTKDALHAAMQSYDEKVPTFTFECTQENHSPTQTEKHFCANTAAVLRSMFKDHTIKQKTNAIPMFLQALTKEREELTKGNHVFYHGRRWDYDFWADMDKMTHNLKHPQKPVQDLRLRFDDNQEGALCLNYALFANATRKPSNTASYVVNNHDFSSATSQFNIDWLFRRLNMQNYANQYKQEFAKLQELHKKANPHGGSLLMLSVPDKHLDIVYPAQEGSMGYKPQARKVGNSKTSDTRTIINALKADPTKIQNGNSDYIEFALRITSDLYDKVRIYPMSQADPAKYKEYTDFRDQLFAKIRADMQQNGGNIS